MGDGVIEVLARGVCVMDGHLLLCQGRTAANTYLPGGHVEFGERAARALARELREEMGKPARVGRFLGAVEHTFVQKSRRHAEINLLFEMSIRGIAPGRPLPCREAWIRFLWVPLGRLRTARLEPAVLCSRLAGWLEAGRATPAFASSREGWIEGAT